MLNIIEKQGIALECKYLFENAFKQNLLYLRHQYSFEKSDLFEKIIVQNNPFVNIDIIRIRGYTMYMII